MKKNKDVITLKRRLEAPNISSLAECIGGMENVTIGWTNMKIRNDPSLTKK